VEVVSRIHSRPALDCGAFLRRASSGCVRGVSGLLLAALLILPAAPVHASGKTLRICDDTGCSDRPRESATFDSATIVAETDNPEQARRLAALTELARKDPRAAYDLGLRYFRGDGVRQNSYLAIEWMRDAGERGNRAAQSALGRFYLAGLEEMGSDPAEAERWLSLAFAGGDREAGKLLEQARKAKEDEQAHYRWRIENRDRWLEQWSSGYSYRWHWRADGWHDYR